MTRDELKDKMADHYEWVEALFGQPEVDDRLTRADDWLDRFARDWADYAG